MIKKKVRVIARLEIKGEHVVKGIRMEGLRKVGSPDVLMFKYASSGIDEIIFIDTVASLYERNHLKSLITNASKEIFIPKTVGGGVRSVEDCQILLRSGADKITINTYAVRNPDFITEIASIFGSQCIVVEIQAKKKSINKWEAYIDNGRQRTDLDVVSWAKQVEKLGAGEILLTSVDRDGTNYGPDLDLYSSVTSQVSIPVIGAGGFRHGKDLSDGVFKADLNAVAFSHVLHFGKKNVSEIKMEAKAEGIDIREIEPEK